MTKATKEERWLPTSEFAAGIGVKGETTRRSLCVNGHYLGIVPKKLPNGRLLWSESEMKKLLNKEDS